MSFINRRISFTVVLIAAVMLAAFGQNARNSAQAAQAATGGRVRLVHAVPDAPAVDVTIDGTVAARALDYAAATRYLAIAAGDHTVAVAATGTTTSLYQGKVTITAGQALTVVVEGTATAVETGVFEDDLGPVAPGNTRVTAIDAIKDGPAIDILRGDGSPLIQGLKYGTPYGAFDIPATAVSVAVVPSGGAVSAALIKADNVPLIAGTHNTLVTLGTAGGAVKPSTLLLTAPVDADKPADSAFVRFAHAAAGIPAVDLYVGGKLFVPNLEFGAATPHLALDPKAGEVTARAAGSAADSAALLSVPDLGLAGGSAGTVAISSKDGKLIAGIFPDNISALDAKTARLKLISASGGNATLKVGDKSLTSSAKGTAAEMPAGIYDISATVDSPAIALTGKLPLSGGVLYDLIVAGDGTNNKFIIAATSLNEQISSAPAAVGAAVAQADTPVPAAAATQPAEAPTDVPPPPTVAAPPAATDVPQPTETLAAPAATDIPPTAAPPQPTVFEGVLGTVFNLNEGVNLKIREYPNLTSRALALIQKDAALVVIGVRGKAAPTGEPTSTPTKGPTPTVDTKDVTVDAIWLYVTWQAPDGGSVTGWVNNQYVSLTRNGKPLKDFADILTLKQIAENTPGEVSTGAVTPIASVIQTIGTVVVNDGTNLQMRRTPDIAAESIALIPANAQVIVLEKTEVKSKGGLVGEPDSTIWLWVRYQSDSGSVVGWVNQQYIKITHGGRKVEIADIPVAKTIQRGFTEGSVAPVQPPPAAGLIATVDKLNEGANLQLRRDPNTTAESLGLIPNGSQLEVLGRNGDGNWLKVTSDGKDGWISTQYVAVTKNGKVVKIADITNVTTEKDLAASITPGPSPTATALGSATAAAPVAVTPTLTATQ
ncbi:MAG: DUF4397 domain-containing protein [Chloroflexota bacterium]